MTTAAVARGESAGATGEGESRHRRRGERRQYRRMIAGITGGAGNGITGGGDSWRGRRG